MFLTLAEILFLLCILIFPMAGPPKRKDKQKKTEKKPEKSEFGINEYGKLEILRKNKKKSP